MKYALPLTISLALLGLNSSPSHADSNHWFISPATSELMFHVTNVGVPVDGKFGGLSGDVEYDGSNLAAATVSAAIAVDTIDTGLQLRDKHLRTKDFFNVTKFPSAEFHSTKIEPKSDGSFTMTGNLILHGITQTIVFEVAPLKAQRDAGRNHLTATAKAVLPRKKFEVGGITAATISKDVKLSLAIDLIKQ